MTTVRVLAVHPMPRGTAMSIQLIDGDVATGAVLRGEKGAAVKVLGIAFDRPENWREGRRGVFVQDIGTRVVADGDVLRSE